MHIYFDTKDITMRLLQFVHDKLVTDIENRIEVANAWIGDDKYKHGYLTALNNILGYVATIIGNLPVDLLDSANDIHYEYKSEAFMSLSIGLSDSYDGWEVMSVCNDLSIEGRYMIIYKRKIKKHT